MSDFDTAYDRRYVPARRYRTFNAYWEEKRKEMQDTLQKLLDLEQVYELVADALERENLPNDTRITAYGSSSLVEVRIRAVASDTLALFDAVARTIGTALRTRRLHADGEPATNWDSYAPGRTYVWALPRLPARVTVQLRLPDEGLKDLRVYRDVREYTARDVTYSYKNCLSWDL